MVKKNNPSEVEKFNETLATETSNIISEIRNTLLN